MKYIFLYPTITYKSESLQFGEDNNYTIFIILKDMLVYLLPHFL